MSLNTILQKNRYGYSGVVLLGILVVWVLLAVRCRPVAKDEQSVTWVESTPETQWRNRKAPAFIVADSVYKAYPAQNIVKVLDAQPLDSIEGFGGCFNEKGWQALSYLDTGLRDSVLRALFDPKVGCGFTLGRVPIGASDYALDWYSLNDSTGDYAMRHFSIARDEKNLIPYVRAAMQKNPTLKVWGSPWSPPAWMKTNNHYACRSDVTNGNCCAGTDGFAALKKDPQTFGAYALYLTKFVAAWRRAGIPVYAVHPQNEPYACQVFPSCLWTGVELRDFIRDYLGPTMRAHAPDCQIWLGTLNSGDFNECTATVLADTSAAKYISGVGYQWAGKYAIAKARDAYPKLKLMQTESECGNGSNNWAAAEYTFGLMHHYLKAGANSYLYWNMVLDTSGLSAWGWQQNALISVDTAARTFKLNPEYYVLRHFSQFVKQGARRLALQGAADDILAFRNPDGRIVLVAANTEAETRSVLVEVSGKRFVLNLPPHSFHTLSGL